jgi:hypothetical protein
MSYTNIRGEPVDVRALADKAYRENYVKPPKRKPTVKNGYAAQPGTGPADKRCADCKHKRSMGNYGSKSWIKCELRRATWTSGEGTDILARSPACSKFEQIEPAKP